MAFDFDNVIDRRCTDSLKWAVAGHELPLWVADMDFPAAPAIQEALQRRLSEQIFGYSIVPDTWYQAIQHWWKKRHDFVMEKDWLIFCTGVVPAITCAVKHLSNVGDQVVVQTPVYDIFFHSIENSGRHVLENSLVYLDGHYVMNFTDLEEKLADPLTTLLILCNPHNPAGNLWTKEELARLGALCYQHHVRVISDEIHCDLTDPGIEYVPFAAASGICAANSVTCISASKAFNLAGLQSAAVMVPDEELRQKMARGLNADELAEPNSFAIAGTIAAFCHGADWLDALRQYIYGNKQLVRRFLMQELPAIQLASGAATYLLWLDCHQISEDVPGLCAFIRQETGLYLTAGIQYRGNGQDFMRMNIACPRSRIRDALQRLKQGCTAYLQAI